MTALRKIRHEWRDGFRVTYAPIEQAPLRMRVKMTKKEVPLIVLKGTCINKSISGMAVQLSFYQYGITRVWFPKKYCELHEDGSAVVKIPSTFRSRMDVSQQVRVAKLIRLATNHK